MKLISVWDCERQLVFVNPDKVEGVTKDSKGHAMIHMVSGNSVPTSEHLDLIVERLRAA